MSREPTFMRKTTWRVTRMVKSKATISMTPPMTRLKPLMAWRDTTQPLQGTSMHMLDKHANNKESTQQHAANMDGLLETVITTLV